MCWVGAYVNNFIVQPSVGNSIVQRSMGNIIDIIMSVHTYKAEQLFFLGNIIRLLRYVAISCLIGS